MLKPIESSTREKRSLNGLWRFAPASDDLNQPWTAALPGDLECPVPASYNDIFVLPSLRNHVGKVWYQRTIHIPRGWTDQNIFIRVDSATHAGEVYVNEKLVAQHVGGYLPFEADLTGVVQPGSQVRITIGVDNILTNETIPPGKMMTNEVGQKQQKYWHDFFNYAGLARSVWLCATPKVRVSDITVNTDVEGTTGLVQYDVSSVGSSDETKVELLDRDGKSVASNSSATGQLKVANATLWQPGKAYLYNLHVRLHRQSELIDEYVLAVGIRSIRISGFEILINDKPFYFKGFGKHEDTPVKGKGHDDAWMVHDFELMKWCNANSFRTSHYPYAEEVMEYADRHGWVVIDETPAVGLNINLGGGIVKPDSGTQTFSKVFANDRTQEAHKQVIRELIQRDKNHPSVVMWCITNEPASQEKGARAYFEPLVKLTKELDSRPVTFTNVQFVGPEDDTIADMFDVIGLNRYYGWYTQTGDLQAAEKVLETQLQAWQDKYQRPLLMLEYGADTVTGLRTVHDLPWSEDYQVHYYELYHRVFDRIEAIQGEQVWNFADFGTGPGIFRVDGNRKGIFSRDRKPKSAAYTLQKRWAEKK